MQKITARIEGLRNDDKPSHVEFTSDDVFNYHQPDSIHTWDDLNEQTQMSFAEDYVLWNFARRYGDKRELRVEVDIIPDDGTEGQDRKSYTDDQDRKNYIAEKS